MKNIKKNLWVILILLLVVVIFYFIRKSNTLIFEATNPNISKILNEETGDYFTTKDKNIKILLSAYANTSKSLKDLKEKQKFNEIDIKYYDENVFLLGFGFYRYTYELYSTKDGSKINSECLITASEESTSTNNIVISGYPEYNETKQEKGFCIFDRENPAVLKYLNLTSKLKENETLIKGFELYRTIYSYRIDEEKREITAQVFDKNKKDEFGYGKYVRDVVVKY